MKVINTGNTYRVYDNSLVTFEGFPANVYRINFNPMGGFFIEKYPNIEVCEKIYGVHEKKVEKVLNAFNRSDKNLGVILSGPKGIGKSLTAKLIVEEGLKKDYPVFIVDTYYPGIADYINQIEQESIILFDEFDKTFCGKSENRDTLSDPQTEMLTLFDGLSVGKKLFVITCNEIRNLNDYLVNRPGRFHYHFRFEYPSNEEIATYLQDHLDKEYWDEIDKVVKFANKVNLNYDCLRAIAFELQNGEKFEIAIKDLNIVNTEREMFRITVKLKNGTVLKTRRSCLDLFDDEEVTVDVYSKNDYVGELMFVPSECVYNQFAGCYCADLQNTQLEIDDEDKDNAEFKSEIDTVIIKKDYNNIHYTV